MTRHHIPFGRFWGMRIAVPYSTFLETGGYGWSCGQCPLDLDGRVLHPGDPVRQAERVADVILDILSSAREPARMALETLVVYHAPMSPADRKAMLQCFLRRFGDEVALVPVPVPHFYYDGMCLEVDVFACRIDATSLRNRAFSHDLDGGDLDAALSRWITHNALIPDGLLAAHWFVPKSRIAPIADLLIGKGLAPDPGTIVATSDSRAVGHVIQSLAGPVQAHRKAPEGGSFVLRKAADGWVWLSGRSSAAGGLLDQTAAIMAGMGEMLEAEGFSFADVVKQTTHYIGDASEEALHRNMAIRNRRYEGITPGPASTGVPIDALADGVSVTAVDILLRRRG